MKKLVIAGNSQQAKDWIRQDATKRFEAGDTSVSLSDYITVDSPNRIRGISNPHGVFIGTWIERFDLEGIFIQLLHATDITSNSHRVITQQWGLWKDYDKNHTYTMSWWTKDTSTNKWQKHSKRIRATDVEDAKKKAIFPLGEIMLPCLEWGPQVNTYE